MKFYSYSYSIYLVHQNLIQKNESVKYAQPKTPDFWIIWYTLIHEKFLINETISIEKSSLCVIKPSLIWLTF